MKRTARGIEELARLAILSAMALISVSCAGAMQSSEDPARAENEPFAGFAALTLPRSGVPIGAVWQDAIGPVGKGLPSTLITETRSLSKGELRSLRGTTGSMTASLRSWLGLDAGAGTSTRDSLYFSKATVLTVTSLSSLPLTPGRVIWEAVRLDEFTIEHSRLDSGAIKARLSAKVSDSSQLHITAGANGSQIVRLEGSGLYTGIRVVQLDISQPTIQRYRFDGVSSLDLAGNNYHVVFKPLSAAVVANPPFGATWTQAPDTSCRAYVEITTQLERDPSTMQPIRRLTGVACGPASYQPGRLVPMGSYSKANGTGYVVDELDLGESRFTLEGGIAKFRGSLATLSRNIDLATVTPHTPGWTQ